MKKLTIETALVILAAQVSLTACQPGNNNTDANQVQTLAAANTTFVCATDEGVPATVARTPEENALVIRWKSEFFNKWGWTPQKRCEEVAQKLQRFKESGELNTLSTGQIDGVPVICVNKAEGGKCSEFLFTLEPGDNPETVLNQIKDPNVTTLDR